MHNIGDKHTQEHVEIFADIIKGSLELRRERQQGQLSNSVHAKHCSPVSISALTTDKSLRFFLELFPQKSPGLATLFYLPTEQQ